jgi:hypothetical protein
MKHPYPTRSGIVRRWYANFVSLLQSAFGERGMTDEGVTDV